MTEVLQAFKDKLKVIIQDKSKDDLDRQVADFYLKTLTPFILKNGSFFCHTT